MKKGKCHVLGLLDKDGRSINETAHENCRLGHDMRVTTETGRVDIVGMI